MTLRSLSLPSMLALLAGVACATASPSEPTHAPAARAATTAAPGSRAAQGRRPNARMTRHPAVSADRIAFSFADDLWVVPREGGVATPLVSPRGLETNPRFSPDGERIAFVGNYEGDVDIYTIDVRGGLPQRVTHHPQDEVLDGWTAGGELLFHGGGLSHRSRMPKLFTVSPEGGLPEALPVPYGTFGAISDDGRYLAYTPTDRVGRTWKRYRGGLASDIWLFDLETQEARRLTDFEGTDELPMWHGETLYFVSDAGENHRINLWSLDVESGERRQVTNFDDDVRWPSIGAGAIVFVVGSELRLLDLAIGESSVVDFEIPGAQPQLLPRQVDAAQFINPITWDVSPSAKRLCVEARGDVWTLPAEKGTPRNLTRTSGVAEREPAWSPDGRWIAYMSDESGEYELWVVQSDGKGERRRVTTDGAPFRYSLRWAPDSEKLSLVVKGGYLKVVDVESGEVTDVDEHPLAQYPATLNASWSHDSRWIAYLRSHEGLSGSSVHLYEVETGERHQVTAEHFAQTRVCFDRAGDYLYYVSESHYSPTYSDIDSTWVYRETSVVHVVPLRADMDSPFAPEVDEETWEEVSDEEESDEGEGDDSTETSEAAGVTGEDSSESTESEAGDDAEVEGEDAEDEDDSKEEEEDPMRIDLEGFERRAIPLPIDPGAFGTLSVAESGALLFLRRKAGGYADLKTFDVSADEPEEELVVSDVEGYTLNAKGDMVLYLSSGRPHLCGVGAGAKGEAVSTSGMEVEIEPREEWAQVFRDTWRLFRDFFYVPNMHGVDWDAAYERYASLLEHAASRRDVAYLIGELISELNVGHAYSGGGDIERGSRRNVGLLGVDFDLEEGAYRITKIYEGGPWDSDARGPLSQPGVDVAEGDYLLAVDGRELDTSKDPWAAFGGKAGKLVTLTVSDQPTLDDDAREVVVRAEGSEAGERFWSWVESNRAYVDEKTNGRVGYIYVRSTGVAGQNDLVRQFYAQTTRDALIIDDRWNDGGQIPTRFVELLNRPVVNYFARRDGADWKFPYDAQHGPKCMLINGSAGSGGDAFPDYFRAAGLGKLVGRRTWGGLVGLSGNPNLIDGGVISIPTFGYFEQDGTWGIEGHGVEPDIEVMDDPGLMVDGGDPQLDAAIELMLRELEERPHRQPQRPAPPDRSGMGLPPEDF